MLVKVREAAKLPTVDRRRRRRDRDRGQRAAEAVGFGTVEESKRPSQQGRGVVNGGQQRRQPLPGDQLPTAR